MDNRTRKKGEQMLRKLRNKNQGFTLIELMIVVAIIGILAVLAIFGVRKYLASAKTAEATNTIGAINRQSVAAYERESAPSELLIGQSSANSVHTLCQTATVVPGAGVPAVSNKKYTANPAANADYHTGNQTTGWTCLKFEMSEPQYYVYNYAKGATCNTITTAAGLPGGLDWVACAEGDLNGDAVTGRFTTGGKVQSGQAIPVTEIAQENPEE
jgi:type IV pilus assembly protein PilA